MSGQASQREFLRGIGALLGAAVLAACVQPPPRGAPVQGYWSRVEESGTAPPGIGLVEPPAEPYVFVEQPPSPLGPGGSGLYFDGFGAPSLALEGSGAWYADPFLFPGYYYGPAQPGYHRGSPSVPVAPGPPPRPRPVTPPPRPPPMARPPRPAPSPPATPRPQGDRRPAQP